MTENFHGALKGARRTCIATLLATAAFLNPAAAVAQTTPSSAPKTAAPVADTEAHPTATQPGLPAVTPNDSKSTANDSEIVVTALKRATSVQKTPISITAVSAETLNRQNITDTNSLARIAPS